MTGNESMRRRSMCVLSFPMFSSFSIFLCVLNMFVYGCSCWVLGTSGLPCGQQGIECVSGSMIDQSVPMDSTLDQFLANVTIHLPELPVSLSLPILAINGNLTGMNCSQISVGSIQSSLSTEDRIDGTKGKVVTFFVSLSDVNVVCMGYLTQPCPFPAGAAPFQNDLFVAVPGLQLNLQIALFTRYFEQYNITLAERVQTQNFSLFLNISNMNITGSNSVSDTFQADPSDIMDEVNTAIPSLLNTTIYQLIDSNLTHYLQSLIPKIGPFAFPSSIRPYPHSPPSPYGIADLKSSPILTALEYISKDVLQNYLNSIIHDILQGQAWTLSSSDFLPFELLGLLDISINFAEIDIFGLETFGVLDFFNATDNSTFATTLTIEKLNISAVTNLNLLSGGILSGASLSERFNITIGLHNISLDVATLMWIREQLVNGYQLNQLLTLNCSLNALMKYQMQALFVSAQFWLNVDPLSGGALEVGLDGLIDHLISLFTSNFEDGGISAFTHVYITEPIRHAINSYMANITSHAGYYSCPDAVVVETFNTDKSTNVYIFGSGLGLCILFTFWMFCCVAEIKKSQGDGKAFQSSFLNEEVALVAHPKIPFLVRLLVPIVIIFTFPPNFYSSISKNIIWS